MWVTGVTRSRSGYRFWCSSQAPRSDGSACAQGSRSASPSAAAAGESSRGFAWWAAYIRSTSARLAPWTASLAAGSSGIGAASGGLGSSGGRRWRCSSGSSAGSGRSTGTRHLPVSAPRFGYVSPWATALGRIRFKSPCTCLTDALPWPLERIFRACQVRKVYLQGKPLTQHKNFTWSNIRV